MTLSLELLAAAVLSLDAVVAAAVLLGRWRDRRSVRHRSAERPLPVATPMPYEPAASPSGATRSPAEAAPAGPAWQPWLDPAAMSAEATATWRRALRRDFLQAEAGRHEGVLLHLEIDAPGAAPAEVGRLAGVLGDVIASSVRPTDHIDRTGPGRFHVLLWGVREAAGAGVGRRIRAAFGRAATGARLLTASAELTAEDEAPKAIQRAADAVARLRAGPEPPPSA